MTTLAPALQSFFTDRLVRQRQASGHTIAAYRDTFRLLLTFAEHRTGSPPSRLRIEDLDASLIGAFLDHLEHDRGNSIRTRNARLAAIHSLFRYAALRHPEHSQSIQRVLAIPPKRFDRKIVTYLTDSEVVALLAAPDRTSWIGRRDHTILTTMIQTGLRASEVVGLDRRDVALGVAAHISCLGKGRKQRITPLTKTTAALIDAWITERGGQPTDPLFPGRISNRLSRDTLERRIAKHAASAALSCPSIAKKTVSPHTLRHTAAMRLLTAGVDTTVIALWLGHETVATTQIYVHADLALKERALARTAPLETTPGRYQPDDTLIAFLEGL
jgi:integrase/recombinase XerD